jgi:hypothetical protein
MSELTLTTRGADLGSLVNMLRTQQTRKVDHVLTATTMRAEGGIIVVQGAEADVELTDEGVTSKPTDGRYDPTDIFVGHLSERFKVNVRDLRRWQTERPDVFDAVINGLIHGDVSGHRSELLSPYPADARSFLFRGFRGEDGNGIARGLMSNTYKIMDNLDMLFATLEGIEAAGVKVEIDSCDLSERSMYVHVVSPEVRAMAPRLLEGYGTPFKGRDQEARVRGFGWSIEQARAAAEREGQGYAPGKEPVVNAGFVIKNSELGFSRFTITPRINAIICGNGVPFEVDAMGERHLGSRLDDGEVKWSEDTKQKHLAAITAKTRDTVRTFLSPDYLDRKIAEIERLAGKPVDEPERVIETVAKTLRYTENEQDMIMRFFTRSGQETAAGVMNAVTAVAQTVANPDRAAELESSAVKALELAAR